MSSHSKLTDVDLDLYVKLLIAKYLKSKSLNDSLEVFVGESLVSKNLINSFSDESFEDLADIISDRIQFNEFSTLNQLKSLSINETLPNFDDKVLEYIPSWNVQNSHIELRCSDTSFQGLPIYTKFTSNKNELLISTSTKQVEVIDTTENTTQRVGQLDFQKKQVGIVKVCGHIDDIDLYYSGGIDGKLSLFDSSRTFIESTDWKLHNRIISSIDFIKKDTNLSSWYVISCGLDNILKLSILKKIQNTFILDIVSEIKLASPVLTFKVALIEKSDSTIQPIIFLARSEYTRIITYIVEDDKLIPNYEIALNNAQFSTHSFDVRDFEILHLKQNKNHKNILTEHSMLAIATSHIPYMRLILVNIPKCDNTLNELTAEDISSGPKGTKVFYDQILFNMATEISQDPYSQPIVKKMPNSNSIIVGSDNGLYAIDIRNGDSWILNIKGNSESKRVKTMDVCQLSGKLVVALADKTINLYRIIDN